MNRIFNAAILLAGTLLLCWAAFYNGFPLVYSDTATYLESGFTLETPLDRPIVYGLLLRLFSFNGWCVWTIIFAQSFILAWLIHLCCQQVTGKKLWVTLTVTGVLAAFTGLPWVASELIADLFTPICVLAVFLVLFGRGFSRAIKVLLYVVLLISTGCHISNVFICLGITTFVFIAAWIKKRRYKEVLVQNIHLAGCVLVAAIAFVVMASSVSKSRHVFMMGHLVETGILSAYLDDHCATENISLCKYRDKIPPGAETFIWNSDGDSVLILTGGWLGTKEEYSHIINETFTTPKYLGMHIRAAFAGTMRQLYTIRVGEGMGKYDSTQLVTQRLKKYFPSSFGNYSASKQSADETASLPVIDMINKIVTVISIVIIVCWLIFVNRTSKPRILLTRFVQVIAGAYFLNCMICASLATVANRFGSRMSWMFVALAVLIVIEAMISRRQKSAVLLS